MKRPYLHLSLCVCAKCSGPVIAGSLAVRENEISKETDIRQVGAICLSCGHRQNEVTNPELVRHFSPVEWGPVQAANAVHSTIAYVEAPNRAELR
jgi:hypothetical protein